jgi:predicted DNA-binding protein (MmcQ/YjbR family)
VVTIKNFKRVALSFPEALEVSHFEKTSFRVNKKIFATLDLKANLACIKLSKSDQDIFSLFDKYAIFPAPENWGRHGWTNINLLNVRKDMFIDALTAAYCKVAPKKLFEHLNKTKLDK